MPSSFSTDSYHRFEQSVKRKTRYVYDVDISQFLKLVIKTSKSRKRSIKTSQVFWRAQRGYTWRTEYEGEEYATDVPAAFDPERMKPKPEYVGDGRVNPRGIPCLYMASTEDTAMAEVRPWVGSYISLGQFKVMREATVVDCSGDKRIFPSLLVHKKPPQLNVQELEKIVWGDIGYALSRPVTPDEPVTEYVPTQILAEAFRSHGYDGIVYKSLLGKGLNIALFDCDAAELINCGLHETTAVSYTFSQSDNPYFVMKHYPKLQKKDSGNTEENTP